jgi:predicted dehydrogenase
MSLRVAIVGCGKIADGHIEEIQKMPELAQVVGVCDTEPIMAEQIAMRYRLDYFTTDFDRLLAEKKPDVVHITTPPGSHLALAVRSLEAGAHVYVEKPLTLSCEDSKKLIERVQAAKKVMTIGYTYLFDPPALEMRDLIARGEIGDVVHVESFFGYNLAGPFGAAILGDPAHWVHRLPGKLFHNNIDHLLNKVVEFIDDDDAKVTASGSVRRPQRFGDARDTMADELRVMIQSSKATAYATFSSHIRPPPHYVRVFGTKNTVHADFAARTVTLETSAKLPSAIGRLIPAFEMAKQYAQAGTRNAARFAKSEFHFFSGLNYLFRHYYKAILDGTPPPIPYKDILRVSKWMDDIFAQTSGKEAGK